MRHRVFIGLPISEKLQQEILDWERKFSDLPVRWLQGKNLHITLVPPFYVEDPELEEIKNKLQVVVGFGAFEISFSNVTFGPDPRRPRLIWAEGETSQEMLNLQQKIYQVLGQRPEKRSLKLHLTIARFDPRKFRLSGTQGTAETFSSFPIKKLDEKVDWRDRADRVVLFESILSRGGADYEVVSEILLNT